MFLIIATMIARRIQECYESAVGVEIDPEYNMLCRT